MVQEISFKEISYLELWGPFCPADQNHLSNFCRGNNAEQFCGIILNLDQMSLKDLLSRALAALMFGRAVYAILVESIIKNIPVKLFQLWTSGSGDVI